MGRALRAPKEGPGGRWGSGPRTGGSCRCPSLDAKSLSARPGSLSQAVSASQLSLSSGVLHRTHQVALQAAVEGRRRPQHPDPGRVPLRVLVARLLLLRRSSSPPHPRRPRPGRPAQSPSRQFWSPGKPQLVGQVCNSGFCSGGGAASLGSTYCRGLLSTPRGPAGSALHCPRVSRRAQRPQVSGAGLRTWGAGTASPCAGAGRRVRAAFSSVHPRPRKRGTWTRGQCSAAPSWELPALARSWGEDGWACGRGR